MADAKGVIQAFAASRKWRQPVALLDGVQAVTPAGQYLVWVGLVADIPHQPIVRGVVDIVQCNSQFHRAQAGGEVSAAGADGVDQELAQLVGERGQVSLIQGAQVCRGFYGTQQRAGRGARWHGEPQVYTLHTP